MFFHSFVFKYWINFSSFEKIFHYLILFVINIINILHLYIRKKNKQKKIDKFYTNYCAIFNFVCYFILKLSINERILRLFDWKNSCWWPSLKVWLQTSGRLKKKFDKNWFNPVSCFVQNKNRIDKCYCSLKKTKFQ